MTQLSASQSTLLKLLGDGQCHSGSELGMALGVTRSAIWKQIKQLIELGVPIHSRAQQGYQLSGELILLDEEKIRQGLEKNKLATPFRLHRFTSIDSTNRFLKELPPSNQLELCCAELQTQGRGRFGRQWHSPFGENIYCSSRWNLNCDLSKLSGLSLVTSLAIIATLKELHLDQQIQIKWPNDIYWNNKKLCGSLIEILAESNATVQVIIGIGLNVNTDTMNNPLADQAWCSLFEISQHYLDRNQLIVRLISQLECYLQRFMQYDLNVFMTEWEQADYLVGKEITVSQGSETLKGIASGINHYGQLILEDSAGKKHYLSSGDASLKKK